MPSATGPARGPAVSSADEQAFSRRRASINKDVTRFEITAVYTHPDAKVDVVLVHGLNGAPIKTWTAPSAQTGGSPLRRAFSRAGDDGVYWPIDLLPSSLADAPANVLVYGYNSDVWSGQTGRHSASDNFIYQHAQTLISCLTNYRKSEGFRNPIIWVAHSLGGILVKRALLYSNDLRAKSHDDFRSIYVSTYAIIFLGTPHTGSGLARWGELVQGIADSVMPKKIFESEAVLLRVLKRDNETLQNINNHFLDIHSRFRIHMAHENHKTNLKWTKQIIVDAASASPQLPGVIYYGIEATHSGMCKFSSVNAPGYRNVSTAIREWAKEAPLLIENRWFVEIAERQARDGHNASELLGVDTSQSAPSTSEAVGVVRQPSTRSASSQTSFSTKLETPGTPYPEECMMPNPSQRNIDTFVSDASLAAVSDKPEPPKVREQPSEGWTEIQRHRVVKRLDERRYHDRAGSWRETALAVYEPRVTLCRELASGVIVSPSSSNSSRSQSLSRTISSSDAKTGLMQIKKGSPPPPRGGKMIFDRTRSRSGDSAEARPHFTRFRFEDVAAFEVFASGSAATESCRSSQGHSAGLLPRSASSSLVSSSSVSKSLTPETPPPAYASRSSQSRSQSSSSPRPGDRRTSAQSSPLRKSFVIEQSSSSLSAHTYEGTTPKVKEPTELHKVSPAAPLPLVRHSSSSLSERPGMEGHSQAASSSTVCHHSPESNLTSAAEICDAPQPEHERFAPSSSAIWSTLAPRPRPDGYTSQPMSREPSHMSRAVSSSPGCLMVPSSRSASATDFGRNRRPSVTETEPSPRLPSLNIAQTSYHAWEAGQYHHCHRHHQVDKGNHHSGHALPFRPSSSSGAFSPHFHMATSSRAGPDNIAAGGFHSSGEGAKPKTEGVNESSQGGEGMSRTGSGSGGIRLDSGQLIEFGNSPTASPDLQERRTPHASWWATHQLHRQEVEASKEDHNVGLGIL